MSGFTITLKNADGVSADEHLHDLEPATSILAVKELLALRYPGHPPVSSQRMVYAGRLLKDAETLGQVIHPGARMPVIFHLMLSLRRPVSDHNLSTPSAAEPSKATPSAATGHAAAPPAPRAPGDAPTPPYPLAAEIAATSGSDTAPNATPTTSAASVEADAAARARDARAAAAAAAEARAAAAASQSADLLQPQLQPQLALHSQQQQAAMRSPEPSLGAPQPATPTGIASTPPPLTPEQLADLQKVQALGAPTTPEQVDAVQRLQQQLHHVYYEAFYKAYMENLSPSKSQNAVVGGSSPNSSQALLPPSQGALLAPDADAPQMDAGQRLEQEEAVREGGAEVHLFAGARAHVNPNVARNPERPEEDEGGGARDAAGRNHKSLVLALKLALVVCILGQDASRERMTALCLCATAIFLHQTGVLRVFGWLQAIAEGLEALAPDVRVQDDLAALDDRPDEPPGDAVADGMVGDDGLQAQRVRRAAAAQGGGEGITGLLVDIGALMVGFFTSLVPRTPADAHAF